MTNQWTDLIDTDPVGAWHARPEKIPDEMFEGMRYIRESDRLMSNLAVLCEVLSENTGKLFLKYLTAELEKNPDDRGKREGHNVRIAAMVLAQNPDGSRQFPEVK